LIRTKKNYQWRKTKSNNRRQISETSSHYRQILAKLTGILFIGFWQKFSDSGQTGRILAI
jgi:hypothetical protein